MHDVVVGRWCMPRNHQVAHAGTVEDDAAARALGYEAATVADGAYLEQFLPLLLKAFGSIWWRRGNISLYYVGTTRVEEPCVATCSG